MNTSQKKTAITNSDGHNIYFLLQDKPLKDLKSNLMHKRKKHISNQLETMYQIK